MSQWGLAIAAVYVIGVMWGLLVVDARPVERVALAVLWPIGPLAFVATLAILVAAAAIAFPLVGLPVLVAIAALGWWLLT